MGLAMKRDWKTIRVILEQVENGSLKQYYENRKYEDDPDVRNEDTFLGHIEILVDAGILKHCSVKRDNYGRFANFNSNGVFISMHGHDLLDAMRDKSLWERLALKAKQSGLSLSWEVIKASMPVVIGEMLNN